MTFVGDEEATSLDQLASCELDTLVRGVVRLRGDRDAIGDTTGGDARPLCFAELDRRISALAGLWRDLGLKPGDCVLVAGGAVATSVIALLAALRAGLDIALAPLHLSTEEMLDFAHDTAAVALAAETAYGGLAPAEELLCVAAQAPLVRLVCSLGPGRVDGAVAADPERLAASARPEVITPTGEARILTRAHDGEVVIHRQRTLVAAALDLVTRARIGMRLPIITTIAPVTFAGLAAGPVAALLAGAPLLLHGPFASAGFAALLQRAGPAHLVAPAALLPALQRAGLAHAATRASLILVTRRDDASAPAAGDMPDDLAGDPAQASAYAACMSKPPPIVDLLAIGETAAVAELRGHDGKGVPAPAEPHPISSNDQRAAAVARDATFALAGAAVTDGADAKIEAVWRA